jgi:hypothetical protein
MCLELVAQVASLTAPHQRVVRLERGIFAPGIYVDRSQPVMCAARHQSAASVEVTISQRQGEAVSQVLAAASVELADASRLAPTIAVDEWVINRRGHEPNGEALYDAGELKLGSKSDTPRVLQWALSAGVGQLGGGIDPTRREVGPRGPGSYLASPAVIDGLEQLSRLLWYALSGVDGRVEALDTIEWYRTPRAHDELIGALQCRGSLEGSPIIDAVVYGADRRPALELKGLRLETDPKSADRRALPRSEWQSFVRLLGRLGQT